MFDSIDLFRPKMPTTFGSAEWMSLRALKEARMLEQAADKNAGPFVGMLTPLEIGGMKSYLAYANGEGHLLTLAPTRAGKGRGQIIPNLIAWPGSALVLDIKGENYEFTAGFRHAMGHRAIRFSPFEAGGLRWNPIDRIGWRASTAANDPIRQENARLIANLMLVPNPHAKDPYWDNAAKTLLQGLLLYVSTRALHPDFLRERSMAEVRRLMTQAPEEFETTLHDMASSPEDWVRESANTMLRMSGSHQQMAGVLTTLLEHTSVWSFARVKDATAHSEFTFSDLREGPPTTIYLIIPPEALTEYRSVLRVMIGWAMYELRQNYLEARDGGRPPVLFVLDEFPQLGAMKPIEDALLYIASYGVKFWFFVQDLSQLQQHYEKTWRQFFANCGTRCFFGVSDLETAKLVSEMTGQATVRNRSYNVGASVTHTVSEQTGSSSNTGYGPGGASGGSGTSNSRGTSDAYGSNSGLTTAFVGRALMTPDEVLRMPHGRVIVLSKFLPAMRAQLPLIHDPKVREIFFAHFKKIDAPRAAPTLEAPKS